MALLSPTSLTSQQRGVEIGLDGGARYELNAELLTLALPFQRGRAAFPSGSRLAFEPALSFTRLSTGGASVVVLVFEVGALYDFGANRSTYTRPFFGYEYAEASFSLGESVVDLGIGFGTRSRIADRLAVRIEGTVTGR